jgi:hypothetical protein
MTSKIKLSEDETTAKLDAEIKKVNLHFGEF